MTRGTLTCRNVDTNNYPFQHQIHLNPSNTCHWFWVTCGTLFAWDMDFDCCFLTSGSQIHSMNLMSYGFFFSITWVSLYVSLFLSRTTCSMFDHIHTVDLNDLNQIYPFVEFKFVLGPPNLLEFIPLRDFMWLCGIALAIDPSSTQVVRYVYYALNCVLHLFVDLKAHSSDLIIFCVQFYHWISKTSILQNFMQTLNERRSSI